MEPKEFENHNIMVFTNGIEDKDKSREIHDLCDSYRTAHWPEECGKLKDSYLIKKALKVAITKWEGDHL